jgi:hypothetical protein
MRGANGPMDVITRAEFDDSMKNFPTRHELSEFVSVVKETIRENLADLKVDLFADIEAKVTRKHNLLELGAVKTGDLKDAKNEILAAMRRNIGDAIEPLKVEIHKVGADLHKMGADIHKMGARIDEMKDQIKMVADGHIGLDEKLTRLGDEMRETFKHHERRLDRHDADLYKLRQSGVLQ